MDINVLRNTYDKMCTEQEDVPVLDFLRANAPSLQRYLEVGAGRGRFPRMLALQPWASHIAITALEINSQLAAALASNGIHTIQGTALHMPFRDEQFDVIHCSHVIEHFGYPDVITLLHELFRVTKSGGYVIIRTPLMHAGFYDDIDHIRPYPLKTLMRFFTNEQQQITPNFHIKLVTYWNRHQAVELHGLPHLSHILTWSWIRFGYPRSRANGYVAVFQKI